MQYKKYFAHILTHADMKWFSLYRYATGLLGAKDNKKIPPTQMIFVRFSCIK